MARAKFHAEGDDGLRAGRRVGLRGGLAGALGALVWSSAGAVAQDNCSQWMRVTESFPTNYVPGQSGAASLRVMDLDGPGPLPEELLVGSRVGEVGGTLVGGISRFNGQRWLLMPGRLLGSSGTQVVVHDIELHAGRLFVGGKFASVSGVTSGPLAELRNGVWDRVNSNAGTILQGSDAFDLQSDGATLLVMGQQMTLTIPGGGSGLTLMAGLTGTTWSNVWPRVNSSFTTAVIRDGSELVAGGQVLPAPSACILRGGSGGFVADFQGSNTCVTSSLAVRRLQVHQGQLYACGNVGFGSRNPGGAVLPGQPALLRWNGSDWEDAGFPAPASGQMGDVHGLIEFQGVTYAFGSSCSDRFPRLSRLVNGQWTAVSLPQNVGLVPGQQAFFDAAVYDEDLYLCSDAWPALSRYNGTGWEPLATPVSSTSGNIFNSLLVAGATGEDVYLCGTPSDLWAALPLAAQSPMARLTSKGWVPVGQLQVAGVQAVAWGSGGAMIALRTSTGRVRVWDGATWTDPVPNVVGATALAVWEGDLIIADAGVIRRWNGTTLTAVSPVSPPRAFNNTVRVLAVYGGQLVAAGNFTQMTRSGDTPMPATSVMAWNGSDWETLGGSTAATITGDVQGVHATTALGTPRLFAGGVGLRINGVAQSNSIIFDGATWSTTMGSAGQSEFASVGSVVYRVGGSFLDRYDAAQNTWVRVTMPPSTSVLVRTIAGDPQGRWLHATGRGLVSATGEGELVAYGRLSLGKPVLERQPEDVTGVRGESVGFSVDVVSGRATFQWRRDGVGLVDGTTSYGSLVRGSAGPWLIIENAQAGDQGVYDCVVTATCGAALGVTTSAGATLTVTVPVCDSIDFNNDGSIFDPQDIAAFLSVYSEGLCVPATATCNDIDFNNDGSIFDPQDIASFISVYGEGPCL